MFRNDKWHWGDSEGEQGVRRYERESVVGWLLGRLTGEDLVGMTV
jgi:hypothetical protein